MKHTLAAMVEKLLVLFHRGRLGKIGQSRLCMFYTQLVLEQFQPNSAEFLPSYLVFSVNISTE